MRSRRSYLSALAGSILIAGCTGGPDQGDTQGNSPTSTPSSTETETPTQTQVQATTRSPTDSPTPADTPTQTPTQTPTETPTDTPTQTPTPTESEPSAFQPKIREVTDNFGHTFDITRDSDQQPNVDDELLVEDTTKVELCVTDLEKAQGDDIRYKYRFGNRQSYHPDNSDGWVDQSCWTWTIDQEYYSDHWGFSVYIQNGDEIYYHNRASESDFRVVVHYINLALSK